MTANILLVLYLLFVLGWFIYWFGTYQGERILNRWSNIQLHGFAFFCGSLLISLGLAFGYVVWNNFLEGRP